MALETKNLGLYLEDSSSTKFKKWRDKINGPTGSNMEILDDAVASKQDKLTGTQGQVVGFDKNGNAVSQSASHYGTCSTAAGTVAKVVAATGFSLVTGAKVAVKFTVTNTAANPTLNVNSTGAKAIYYRGAAITAGYLAANRTYEFVYNGTQYELVGDIDTNTTYTAASSAPQAAGTAAVGTSTKYAREDHVHPAQTTVSGNAGTATKLATARTIDGVDFNGSAAITHYGNCDTAAPTAAKTVALTGFKLVTGAEIAVKFTVTNTAANPTLNVNGTGAKAIFYRGAAISAGYLAANRVYKFVYDGTNYEFVGDINTNTTYTAASAAPKEAGTAAVGTSIKYAREDHVHPEQTTVSGNAGTATKLATARNIKVNLASESTASFDGTANVSPGVSGILPVMFGGTGFDNLDDLKAELGLGVSAATLGVSSVLNDNSWADIKKISDQGIGASCWSVGDTKSVLINGTIGTLTVNATCWAFILGFNHNSAIEGKGITFGGFKTAQTIITSLSRQTET